MVSGKSSGVVYYDFEEFEKRYRGGTPEKTREAEYAQFIHDLVTEAHDHDGKLAAEFKIPEGRNENTVRTSLGKAAKALGVTIMITSRTNRKGTLMVGFKEKDEDDHEVAA